MSSNFNSLIDRSKLESKRAYLEDDEQCEMSQYIQCKKIKLSGNEINVDVCCSFNLNQNVLPPSPPLDYMKCEDCENEEFSNFSLNLQVNETDDNTIAKNDHKTKTYETNDSILTRSNYKTESKNQREKTFIFNTNKQQNKIRHIPKFTIGFRSDCKKCRDGVPNHYGHINFEYK